MTPEEEKVYPTAEELDRLRTWPSDDPVGFLEYARSLWWAQEWGWPEFRSDQMFTSASTGGWSGNEEIVAAMQASVALWDRVFFYVRRGGHYMFHLAGDRCTALRDHAEEPGR
jgi:hypothetical protein